MAESALVNASLAGARIAVSADVFIKNMAFLKAQCHGINNDIKIDSITKCSGIMLINYIDFSNEIEKAILNYKKLLEKDLNDICKSEEKYHTVDQAIANLFNRTSYGPTSRISGSGK